MENTTYGIAFIPHVIMPMDNDYDILWRFTIIVVANILKRDFYGTL